MSLYTLGGWVIMWRSIKKGCIVDCTMEGEYVATYEGYVWIYTFLNDWEVVPKMHKPLIFYYDSSETVYNSKEPRSHNRGKWYKMQVSFNPINHALRRYRSYKDRIREKLCWLVYEYFAYYKL